MCKAAFLRSTKHGRLFLPHMEAAMKDVSSELDETLDATCEQLCQLATSLLPLSKHLDKLAAEGAHLHSSDKYLTRPGLKQKHAMKQERTLSSMLSLLFAKLLDLGIVHQFCLGDDNTHVNGIGVCEADYLNLSAELWRILFLMECKRLNAVVGGKAVSSNQAMDQVSNQWHRSASVFKAYALLAFVTDEVGLIVHLVCESNEAFRDVFSGLLDPFTAAEAANATDNATAAEAATSSFSADSLDASSVTDASASGPFLDTARLGVSAVLGSAAWSDRAAVGRLMQRCRAVIQSILAAGVEHPYVGPTLPKAVIINVEKGLLAAQGGAPGMREEPATTASVPEDFICAELLSSCTSRWVKWPGEQFVVKVYDHTTRKPPTIELLTALVEAASDLEDEVLCQFYKSWRVTEIGPEVAIVTYRWLETKDVSIQDVATMLKLYESVFAMPRKLSSREEVAVEHCHGDSLLRNFEPPALLDLDFVGVKGSSYPEIYNTDASLMRHPDVEAQITRSMELSHDLWGFAMAILRWFPAAAEGPYQVGLTLKAELLAAIHKPEAEGFAKTLLNNAIKSLDLLQDTPRQPQSSSRPSTAPDRAIGPEEGDLSEDQNRYGC
jgi:hypothetical protein